MAQLMQGGGLDRRFGLAGADQHRHLGLQAPDPRALHLQQLQHGAAMAGSAVLDGGAASLHLHLGLGRIAHQLDRQQLLPAGHGSGHSTPPALLPQGRGAIDSCRFEPHAPERPGGPAGRGGAQLLAVVGGGARGQRRAAGICWCKRCPGTLLLCRWAAGSCRHDRRGRGGRGQHQGNLAGLNPLEDLSRPGPAAPRHGPSGWPGGAPGQSPPARCSGSSPAEPRVPRSPGAARPCAAESPRGCR